MIQKIPKTMEVLALFTTHLINNLYNMINQYLV